MTTILTNYATTKMENYEQLKEEAQTNFTSASETLSELTEDYETLVANAAELDKTIVGLRQSLSVVTNTPADITQINEDLRDALIERAHLTGEIADTQQDLNTANLNVNQYVEEINYLQERFALAEVDVEKAENMKASHDSWTSSETEDAITVVRDNATALLGDSFVADPEADINPAEILSDAASRIEGDIPEVLRDRAKARVSLVSSRIADSLSIKNTSLGHALTQTSSSRGDSGLIAQRWSELESAHDQLGQYALTTVSQYNTAIELLQSVVASAELSESSAQAIDDVALAEDADAVTTEVALHAAKAAVEAKHVELEEAIIDAVIADVNADPADDGTVQTKESELSSLEDDLSSAESAHTDEFATLMDLWEASVPDYIWTNFHNYEKAIALLTAVSSSSVAGLLTAVTDAETALVTAMQTEDNNHRLVQFLESATELLTKEYDYLISSEKSLSLSALRGDF